MTRRWQSFRAAAGDEGGAIVEFVLLTLLLLIPLVYLVLTVGRIQAASFAAESGAQESARQVVVEGVAQREAGASVDKAMASGVGRADAALGLIAGDFGFSEDDAKLAVACEGQCLAPGGNIATTVTVSVALPGIPGFVGDALPLNVSVSADARQAVDSVAVDQ